MFTETFTFQDQLTFLVWKSVFFRLDRCVLTASRGVAVFCERVGNKVPERMTNMNRLHERVLRLLEGVGTR